MMSTSVALRSWHLLLCTFGCFVCGCGALGEHNLCTTGDDAPVSRCTQRRQLRPAGDAPTTRTPLHVRTDFPD
eukprot:3914291-Amphidinium_carterae.1